MAKSSVKVSTRTVTENMVRYKDRSIRTAFTGMQILSANNENRAKTNRKWKDRTGQARGSITGSYESSGVSIIVGLAIGAEHGIFLEKANGGKYAIVWPTINESRQELTNVARIAMMSGGNL